MSLKKPLIPLSYLGAAFVAAIAFIVYLPALGNGFVNWDDPVYVTENLMIRSFDFTLVKAAFTTVLSSNWHPLTIISHALDYALFGPNPAGHHLTSIIIHSLNAALVFILAMLLSSTLRPNEEDKRRAVAAAVVTALFFAIHPLRVESVAWVSERKDLLYSFFYLTSVITYIRYATSRKAYFYALSLTLFALSLLSKPMAVTLPVVLLILDYYPLKKRVFSIKTLAEKTPYFILSFGASLGALLSQSSGGAISSFEVFSTSKRLVLHLFNALYGYAFYIVKTLWPVRLAPLYPYTANPEILSFKYIGAAVLVIAITIVTIYYRKRTRLYIALWAYFIISLLPVIGIVQIGAQAAADRYTYLPSLALALPLGLIAGWAFASKRGKGGRVAAATVTAVILVILALLSINQTAVWKDSLTLWNHELALYPNTVAGPYNNRGYAYRTLGKYDESIKDFTRALEIDPYYRGAYNNRAYSLQMLGDYDHAVSDFSRAIRLMPTDVWALNNRGAALGALGRFNEAVSDFDAVIKINPRDAGAYINRATANAELGNYLGAIADFKEAARLAPGDPRPKEGLKWVNEGRR